MTKYEQSTEFHRRPHSVASDPVCAAGGAIFQIISRPGRRDSGDGFSGVDVHIVAVIVAENFDGGVALVSEGFGAPLGHPIRTLYLPSVAVLGQDWLAHIWSGQIIGK